MPPGVNKQSPAVPKTKPAAITESTDVLDQAVDVTDLKELYQKVTIYGPNRTGKTTLACEWEKPLLLVAFEPDRTGGATSVASFKGVKLIRMKPQFNEAGVKTKECSEFALELAQRLKTDDYYKTVVIDSCTSLQDWLLRELMGWDDERTQLSYGSVPMEIYQSRSEKVRDILRPFLDLAKHTIIIAHERDHNPPKEDRKKLTRGLQIESLIGPDIGGASVIWLNDNCGYICRLYVDTKTVSKRKPTGIRDKTGKPIFVDEEMDVSIRRLLVSAQKNFIAGCRVNTQSCPDFVEGSTSKELYDNFQALIAGK